MQIGHVFYYLFIQQILMIDNNYHLVAGVKGLEPSTYRVTGDRSNQLSYTPTYDILVGSKGLEPLTPSV